ncbi:MAG: C39 family peptidase [Spirochaetales bacterium]|nr:C39 family peptidase [Spirochaetales bacterium]
MIKGARRWNDRYETFYTQTNNPTEGLLKKLVKKLTAGWLETCGPTAACSCLAAVGYGLSITTPGGYSPQHEEILSDFLNDPRNYAKLEEIRKGVEHIPGNRIPQFYPFAVKEVYGAKGKFMWLKGLEEIARILQSGKAIQLCLKKPGHYIAAVAYDDETNEIIFNDPWPQRSGLKKGGFNERMDRREYETNVHSFIVVYEGV